MINNNKKIIAKNDFILMQCNYLAGINTHSYKVLPQRSQCSTQRTAKLNA